MEFGQYARSLLNNILLCRPNRVEGQENRSEAENRVPMDYVAQVRHNLRISIGAG